MDSKPIYTDKLVSMSEQAITFKHYYYPSRKSKTVRLADIDRIWVKAPTLRNGKWRIFGTGSFKTWFPEDVCRPQRDRIFFAELKNKWVRIGFTVEDADRVEAIFRKKQLIRQ
jgi:hypothetical protein